MRTTVTLDDDVAAAVEELRRRRSLGLSQAVNELIRSALSTPRPARKRFKQRTYPIGLQIDVTDVADALEILEGPSAR
jgi:ribbon-helix-helix CopG family protein